MLDFRFCTGLVVPALVRFEAFGLGCLVSVTITFIHVGGLGRIADRYRRKTQTISARATSLASRGNGFATVSNPQPSPPCSLITVRAFLSSRSPANFERRRRSTYASYCTFHGVSHQIAGPKTAPCRPGAIWMRIGRYDEPLVRYPNKSGAVRLRDHAGNASLQASQAEQPARKRHRR